MIFQTNIITNFRGAKGTLAESNSSVHYSAYVMFERSRRAQDKPRSERRLEMKEFMKFVGKMSELHRRD